MPREFYTEKDIEDLFQRGIRSLRVTENVVLTELAYEKARRLDVQLITDLADNPPAAPVRPYLSQVRPAQPKPTIGPAAPVSDSRPAAAQPSSDIEKRIRAAVIARLGDRVDAALLENIIHRVVKSVGLN